MGIIIIGARFLLVPSTAAAGFGIAAWHAGGKADPYLSVKGVRDIASYSSPSSCSPPGPHVLGWFELAASMIPIADAIIVLGRGGPKATAYGVHGATAAVLLATAALLFTLPRAVPAKSKKPVCAASPVLTSRPKLRTKNRPICARAGADTPAREGARPGADPPVRRRGSPTYYPAGEHVPTHAGITQDWKPLVYRTDQHGRQRVVRTVYEVVTFQALRDHLRCKEIWITGADRWRNPDKDLPADFETHRAQHYASLRKPLDPSAFITDLREEMRAELDALHGALPRLDWLQIADAARGHQAHPAGRCPRAANLRLLKRRSPPGGAPCR